MTDTIPTEFEVLDERMAAIGGDTTIEILYTGTRWGEGPVYFPAGRFLVWSDIPNERMLRWDEMTGAVGPFRLPSGYVNGNTLDCEGRLIYCEQGPRRVTRTEHDGSITVIADRWQGRRFNSPNDVVVRSDGSIWFTDPPYGILSDYEGVAAEQEIDGCHVYRADPVTGEVRRVADDFDRPNGLAFSLDERHLYVADTRARHIRVFEVQDDGSLANGRVFATGGEPDAYDGLRLDDKGRVWAAAGKALLCYDPDGTLLGRLRLPEPTANLVFGGPKRNRLFMAGSQSLYAVYTATKGASPG